MGWNFSCFSKVDCRAVLVIHFASWEVELKGGQGYPARWAQLLSKRITAHKEPTGGFQLLFVRVFTRAEAGAGGQVPSRRPSPMELRELRWCICRVLRCGLQGEEHCQKYLWWKAKSPTWLLEHNKQTVWQDGFAVVRQNALCEPETQLSPDKIRHFCSGCLNLRLLFQPNETTSLQGGAQGTSICLSVVLLSWSGAAWVFVHL